MTGAVKSALKKVERKSLTGLPGVEILDGLYIVRAFDDSKAKPRFFLARSPTSSEIG